MKELVALLWLRGIEGWCLVVEDLGSEHAAGDGDGSPLRPRERREAERASARLEWRGRAVLGFLHDDAGPTPAYGIHAACTS